MSKLKIRTKIKERRDSRFSIGMIEALLLLIATIAAPVVRTNIWRDWAEKWVGRPGAWVLSVVVLIAFIWPASILARRTKGRLQPLRDADAALGGTNALFLRPFFTDTKVRITNPFYSIGTSGVTIEPAGLGPEEFVGRVLEPYINVREVGGEAPIGNGRVPVPPEKWQDTVIKVAGEASVIIIIPLLWKDEKTGQEYGEGTFWELKYLARTGLMSRAIALMPKVDWRSQKSVNVGWERFRASVAEFGVLLPEYNDDGCAMIFEETSGVWRPAEIFDQDSDIFDPFELKRLAFNLVEALKRQAERHDFELSIR